MKLTVTLRNFANASKNEGKIVNGKINVINWNTY